MSCSAVVMTTLLRAWRWKRSSAATPAVCASFAALAASLAFAGVKWWSPRDVWPKGRCSTRSNTEKIPAPHPLLTLSHAS